MDLRVCPECKQSVLDDDPEVCPFCGAPMKGKPGKSKSAAKPGERKSSPPPASPGKETAKPAVAKKSPAPEPAASSPVFTVDVASAPDIDPFSFAAPAKDCVAVSPKKTKSRQHPVTCPMCDSAGFIPIEAAGQDVKCYNDACIARVFTAPAIVKATAPAPAPAPSEGSRWGLVLVLLGALVLGGAGYGVWLLMGRSSDASTNRIWEEKAKALKQAQTKANIPDQPTAEPQPAATAQEKEEPAPTEDGGLPPLLALEKKVMAEMARVASARGNIASMTMSRRMAARAFATIGDLQKAEDQLKGLARWDKAVNFYRISPLAEIAWKQLAEKNSKGAKSAVDKAYKVAPTIPKFGRNALETAIELATILAATGRAEDAHTLLGEHSFGGDRTGELAAAVEISRATRQFDLDRIIPRNSIEAWHSPQFVAVTVCLVANGFGDEALKWAEQLPDASDKLESLCAWAGEMTTHGLATKQPDEIERAAGVAEKLPPTGHALLSARIALALIDGGDRAAAGPRIAEAQAALQTIPQPAPVAIAGVKEIAKFELPDQAGPKLALLAAAEVAKAQARNENAALAWEDVMLGLSSARAAAPNLVSLRSLRKELNQSSKEARYKVLRKLFDLQSEDHAMRKYNELKQRLDKLDPASETWFRLQVDLLDSAAGWGLRQQAWAEANLRGAESDPNKKEPYLTESSLPQRLAAHFAQAGGPNPAEAAERANKEFMDANPQLQEECSRLQLQEECAKALGAGNVDEAVRLLARITPEPAKDAWALRLACRTVDQQKAELAFRFTTSIKEDVLGVDALRAIAALSARRGSEETIWSLATGQLKTQTEKAACFLGLIEGLTAKEVAQ